MRLLLTHSAVFTLLLALLPGAVSGATPAHPVSNGSPAQSPTASADVIVYTATPSGILAAIEAARLGKSVLLLEPSQHIGGMVTSGLGASDEFTAATMGGLPQLFYSTVNSLYNGDPLSLGGWRFEPHIAEQAFQQMIAQQSKITVVFDTTLQSVEMSGTTIQGIHSTDGQLYLGREFIDASYTGDLMAAAGVTYSVGREATTTYNESFAGVGAPITILPLPAAIDPYIVPGDPTSGLIAHVTPNQLGPPGSADNSVMAYNYRSCFSSDPANQIPFTAPPNYDPAEFELNIRRLNNIDPPSTLNDFFGMNALPNNKFDVNGAQNILSTDEVGMSNPYPNGTLAQRLQIEAEQKRYMQALFYFVATDPRIPANIQAQMNALGLCRDEFTDNNNWPRQIYVREARRMLGAYIFTQSDLSDATAYPDSIGIGGYPSDSHYVHLVPLSDGSGPGSTLAFEGAEFGEVPVAKYMIPYRILTPLPAQATNLLVSVAVSSSHLAFDSLRIEITDMVMGQAAGAAAAFALDEHVPVQSVDYSALKQELYNLGAVIRLTPLPATTTMLAISPNGNVLGSQAPYVLTATVAATNGSTIPQGNVIFTTGAATHTVKLNPQGIATWSGKTSNVGGPLSISAAYQGSDDFRISHSSTRIENVLPPIAATKIALAISPNTHLLPSGSTYTLTVTVSPMGGSTIPTGNAVITIGATSHTVKLNSLGVATYTTTAPIPAGTLNLSAAYQGSVLFSPSRTAIRTETILQPILPTTTSLVLNPGTPDTGTLAPGAAYTLTATVLPAATGAVIPTRSITFLINGTPHARPLNTAGVATYLGIAPKTPTTLILSATYPGAPTYAPSTSTTLHETISPQ